MLVDAAFRSLWLVIFFLHWLFLSDAYLLAWVLHLRSRVRLSIPVTKGLSIMGLSPLLAAAPPVLAGPERANHAFVKALGPASAATAHQLSDQGEQAQTMLHKLQLAFRSHY